MDRRDFLAALAATATGTLPAPGSRLPAHSASLFAPRSAILSPLGVQLYTVRDAMQRDVEGTLARVAEIGYREVEFAGYFDRTPQQIRAALDANHLSAPSAHVSLDALEGDAAVRTIEAAHIVGHTYLVVPSLPAELRRTLDDWRQVAARFDRIGERTSAAGIQFAYHNHEGEFPLLEGHVPFDVLLEAADPQLVQVELDLYWITKAGGDPLAYFRRWPGRIPMVHVKDSMGPPEHRMADVGAGTIDWRSLFAQRRRAGIRHYFVEHDEPADPFASITASYRYLSRLNV